MEEKLRYEIRVTGRVQGVGFRWSAVTEAQKHDITGYIKNLYDGSVYIDAEGTINQLNAFIEWCRKGPGLSIVESVTTVPLPPVNYKDFRVRY
jgi:acylphosphatase